MTSLTVNGSAVAASTLAAAGKLFSATGGSSGNTSTKVGTSTGFKQIFAKGTTTNQTGAGSLPAPSDANFNGWMWDVTTLEGQYLQASTYTPTIHLLASTGTTVTPTVEWYKRSSGGAYTQISTVAGSSIALTTSSQALTFTPPSPAAMSFATGDKLVMWLWVNQTAGGANNSTISVVEATSASSAGVTSEAQTVTPGYVAQPALSRTIAGVGTLAMSSPALSTALAVTEAGVGTLAMSSPALSTALATTIAGAGVIAVDPYGAETYGVRLYGTETLTTTTALTDTLAGVGTLTSTMSATAPLSTALAGVGVFTPTISTTGGPVSLTAEMDGVSTLTATFSLATALTTEVDGVGALTGTTSLTTALSATCTGVGVLTPTLTASLSLASVTIAGSSTLTGTLVLTAPLTVTLAGTSTLTMSAPSLSTLLTGTLPGTGTLAGTLFASLAISATISGDSALTGNVTRGVSFSATIAGIGVLSASNPALTTALNLDCAGQGTLLAMVTYIIYAPEYTTTWQARDLTNSWQARDLTNSWQARDGMDTWETRDLTEAWETRDLETTWKE